MKCPQCQTEMMIDSVTTNQNQEIFNYNCPNKQCVNYGYKEGDKNE